MTTNSLLYKLLAVLIIYLIITLPGFATPAEDHAEILGGSQVYASGPSTYTCNRIVDAWTDTFNFVASWLDQPTLQSTFTIEQMETVLSHGQYYGNAEIARNAEAARKAYIWWATFCTN